MAFFRSSDSFADEVLYSINRHRSRHQVPLLRLNAQISRVSQRWAESLASSGILRHNDSAKYNGEELGENIAMRWSSDGKKFSGKIYLIIHARNRNRNRKLLISRAPTKAKSQEPAYSQALNQNKIDRQRSRSRESGRQTVRRLWWMVFGVETGREAWG